ncbi:MAG: FHA domain-containing protein [Chloroflexi bacterium]|mgnify:FL=1|nr:FHA domain-containing protein [Chloroflexota bacterium]
MSGIVVLILRILIDILLFGFLAWAMLTIWRDLKAQSQSLSAPDIPTITLTRVREDEAGEESQPFVNQAEITIGRSALSDYPIADDTVSARHARLSYHHNQWWVEDLQSTNGTFLNDERVSVPTVIVSGDELLCGQVSLIIKLEDKNH